MYKFVSADLFLSFLTILLIVLCFLLGSFLTVKCLVSIEKYSVGQKVLLSFCVTSGIFVGILWDLGWVGFISRAFQFANSRHQGALLIFYLASTWDFDLQRWYEFKQTLGDSEGQWSLASCGPWSQKSWIWLGDWTATTVTTTQKLDLWLH